MPFYKNMKAWIASLSLAMTASWDSCMNYFYVFILINIIIWTPWLWRYRIKPYDEKKKLYALLGSHPNKERCLKTITLLMLLYQDVRTDQVSRKERKRLRIEEDNFIYGEVDFLSFITILDRVQPQSGEIFCDLGSGAGKAVFTAALNFDFAETLGVEYLPGLCELANEQIKKAQVIIQAQYADFAGEYLKRLKSIQFIQEDFLKIDLKKCHIVFINATCLNYHTWEKLLEKLLSLTSGSRVILTTKKIQHELFEPIYQGVELMSWGMNSLNIYRKV